MWVGLPYFQPNNSPHFEQFISLTKWSPVVICLLIGSPSVILTLLYWLSSVIVSKRHYLFLNLHSCKQISSTMLTCEVLYKNRNQIYQLNSFLFFSFSRIWYMQQLKRLNKDLLSIQYTPLYFYSKQSRERNEAQWFGFFD